MQVPRLVRCADSLEMAADMSFMSFREAIESIRTRDDKRSYTVTL